MGWGGVSKRLWVAALLSPSLVQCRVLRRSHHLEHVITPFSWRSKTSADKQEFQANLIAAAVTRILSPIVEL